MGGDEWGRGTGSYGERHDGPFVKSPQHPQIKTPSSIKPGAYCNDQKMSRANSAESPETLGIKAMPHTRIDILDQLGTGGSAVGFP